MDHTRQRIDAMAPPLLQTTRWQSVREETYINQPSETCGTRAKAQQKTSRDNYPEESQNQSKIEGETEIEVQREEVPSNSSQSPKTSKRRLAS
jgi:hypothetical protein